MTKLIDFCVLTIILNENREAYKKTFSVEWFSQNFTLTRMEVHQQNKYGEKCYDLYNSTLGAMWGMYGRREVYMYYYNIEG